MTDICLLVLIGLPGAGKTQFCKYFLQHFTSTDVAVTHVSFDEIEKGLDRTNYKDLRIEVRNTVDTFLNNVIPNSASNKWILLIDDNMYYRSMRRIYYNLARQYRTGYCQVYMRCNIDAAIARNSLRIENKVPIEIIQDMAVKLEPPGENNWEKNTCELISDREYGENELIQIWDIIQCAMANPMKPEEPASTIEHPASFIHEVDILLRKNIGQILQREIQNGNQNKVKCLSKDLMCKKKDILNNLRNRQTVLPACKDSSELEFILCSLLEK